MLTICMTNMMCFLDILKHNSKKAKYNFSRTSNFFFLEDSFVESVKNNHQSDIPVFIPNIRKIGY